jgi:hypothetical protein
MGTAQIKQNLMRHGAKTTYRRGSFGGVQAYAQADDGVARLDEPVAVATTGTSS